MNEIQLSFCKKVTSKFKSLPIAELLMNDIAKFSGDKMKKSIDLNKIEQKLNKN
jgi:hypothetical protein